ncbi:uncharacterized protein wu:fa56d06 [Rhinichthys klamathensis goyatoka]|uniref:uncharacterized protein wu:fa56d06 n=1 Tax=Rhinichthys klamathensis goyatoka TaxID=3034132 RepID=UPI0024B500BE|nr:uncharacterized protein wu:fa56d06 [Rhinichthys klamathensis goyatoka]
MFRVLLLLLAVAGLHARPLHRFPNGRLKPIGPHMAQHEDRDNSVLKDMNTGVKPKKQIAVPVELRRQGTEPSRRFLMDLNTGMLKEEVGEMNRRVSGFYNPPAYGKRQGTEPSRRFLMDMNTGMLIHGVGEMNRRVSGIYNPPAYEMRKGTQNSQATLVDPRTGQKLPSLSELQRRTAPLDEFRQGTEHQPHILQELRKHHMMKPHEHRAIPADPSRNVLMDLNTGLLKEHRNELDGRVAGSAKWEVVSGPEHEDIKSQDSSERKENHVAVPVELRRQGTEPSRRFLMDMNTGMLKKEVSEMNRRVSGFYNPPAYGKRQGTEPSRRFLMDMNTGMLIHGVGEMNRRVSGFYNPPAYEMRKGTQNSQATLVDPRTGQKLPSLSELQRRTAPLDEFRQATVHQPHILHELRLTEMHKPGSEPSRNLKMDLNTGLLKENHKMSRRSRSAKWEVVSGPEHEDIKSQDSSERKENHVAVPVELRRQGTEPSRRFLMDMNTGMLKKEVSEMNRRVSGFYNPPAYGKRQGTEPSRRFLMDMNTGMPIHGVGEMNRRVSGFYNPPAYEMRKGTQNSQATLVDPRTGQKLPSLSELQRRTAPLVELRQGTERQLHIQELRKHHNKTKVQRLVRRTHV